MSDYARLQEENTALKAQLAEQSGAKSGVDNMIKAENERFRAALRDIADGGETKADMQTIATKALASK